VKKRLGFGNKIKNFELNSFKSPELLTTFIASHKSSLGNDEFIFLNQKSKLVSWNSTNQDKLWLYNLHYFDFLLQDGFSDSNIIKKWINENPVGVGNGWEPYPISLRAINWMKFHLQKNELSNIELNSLFIQVKFLSKNVEYHILGNHLFENGKTLLIAGLFFDNYEFVKQGHSILEKEIPEQILGDGAHFELSPMYHSIILEGMLDVINFSNLYEYTLPNAWLNKIENMLSYHRASIHPDGDISYFNDSVRGIAKDSNSILAYAKNLGFDSNQIKLKGYYPDSGLVRFEQEDDVLIIDGGPIGPDYIPGHAHADNLSFEFSVRSKRVIVNTGISTYESNDRRTHERSTCAHNTVVIGGKNQSETWASFRVANRVKPKNVIVKQTSESMSFCGSYTGELHTRKILWKSKNISIKDSLKCNGQLIESYMHFHPGIAVRDDGENIYLSCAGEELIKIHTGSSTDYKILDYEWCSGFNKLEPAKYLKFSTTCTGQLDIETKFELL
jgi:uncharacterized heparinase superfamily protein